MAYLLVRSWRPTKEHFFSRIHIQVAGFLVAGYLLLVDSSLCYPRRQNKSVEMAPGKSLAIQLQQSNSTCNTCHLQLHIGCNPKLQSLSLVLQLTTYASRSWHLFLGIFRPQCDHLPNLPHHIITVLRRTVLQPWLISMNDEWRNSP